MPEIDKYAELLKTAQETIKKLTDEVSKTNKIASDLWHHKLAFDVTVAMLDKEQIAESDFLSTVRKLESHPSEDLQKRADILKVVDPNVVLDIGSIKDADNGPAEAASYRGALPETPSSIAARQNIIHKLIST